MFKTVFVYTPKKRDNTQITWQEGSSLFHAFHEESEAKMAFNVSEIQELIEVLTELDAMVKKGK